MITCEQFFELSNALVEMIKIDFPGLFDEGVFGPLEIKETLFFALEQTSIECPITLEQLGSDL